MNPEQMDVEQELRLENESYKEKIAELEKWLILLLNNFYEGKPNSLYSIQEGLMKMDELREENFQLKKALLQERKRYMDLQAQFLDYKRMVAQIETDVKDGKDIFQERNALE